MQRLPTQLLVLSCLLAGGSWLGCSSQEDGQGSVSTDKADSDQIVASGGTVSSNEKTSDQEPESLEPCPDHMARIPGGQLNSPDGPATVETFCIDQTEVTEGAYDDCVESGACQPPVGYRETTSPQMPQTGMDYFMAQEYCVAQGKRLPTAQEWAWAATGGPEEQPYPWGERVPTLEANRDLLCWGRDILGEPCDVGAHEMDVTPQGVMDMGGNAKELVLGPEGSCVLGGVYSMDETTRDAHLDVHDCRHIHPDYAFVTSGFRCVIGPDLGARDPWGGLPALSDEEFDAGSGTRIRTRFIVLTDSTHPEPDVQANYRADCGTKSFLQENGVPRDSPYWNECYASAYVRNVDAWFRNLLGRDRIKFSLAEFLIVDDPAHAIAPEGTPNGELLSWARASEHNAPGHLNVFVHHHAGANQEGVLPAQILSVEQGAAMVLWPTTWPGNFAKMIGRTMGMPGVNNATLTSYPYCGGAELAPGSEGCEYNIMCAFYDRERCGTPLAQGKFTTRRSREFLRFAGDCWLSGEGMVQ